MFLVPLCRSNLREIAWCSHNFLCINFKEQPRYEKCVETNNQVKIFCLWLLYINSLEQGLDEFSVSVEL